MEKFTITFQSDDRPEKFLIDSFKAMGVEGVAVEYEEGKTRLTVFCSRAVFRDVVADVTVAYFKSKTLRKKCAERGNEVLYYAYIGTLVGDDFVREKRETERILPEETDVNLNGIFHFRMAEAEANWIALGELADRLLNACREEEDVYALIRYFLGNGTTMKRTLIVDNTVYFDDNNEDMPCLCVSDVKENDIAFNLLFRRPQEIIILLPKKYDERLSDLVRKLGE